MLASQCARTKAGSASLYITKIMNYYTESKEANDVTVDAVLRRSDQVDSQRRLTSTRMCPQQQ